MSAPSETTGPAGFRVVDLLRRDEIDAMGAAISETIDGVAKALRTPYEDSAPEAGLFDRLERVARRNSVYATALLSAVYADAHLDTRIAHLADDPRLLAAIAQQCGPFEPRGATIRVRCSVPAIAKTLHGWHSDVAINTPVRADSTCHTVLGACWIPLGDVHPGNGSLEVVTTRLPAPLAHRRDTGSYVIDEALLAGLPREAISVRAGQAAVIDRFTPHRSLPNPSAQVRWSVVVWVKGILA